MAKLILFDQFGYKNLSKEFRSNDPDLTLNGDDFQFASAIVISGEWTLYPDANFGGNPVSLGTNGGADADGAYKDVADWGATQAFVVRSIQHN